LQQKPIIGIVLTSLIDREVFSKKGRIIFADIQDINGPDRIVLKRRY
jgi:hypothetical protein